MFALRILCSPLIFSARVHTLVRTHVRAHTHTHTECAGSTLRLVSLSIVCLFPLRFAFVYRANLLLRVRQDKEKNSNS